MWGFFTANYSDAIRNKSRDLLLILNDITGIGFCLFHFVEINERFNNFSTISINLDPLDRNPGIPLYTIGFIFLGILISPSLLEFNPSASSPSKFLPQAHINAFSSKI
jgi:hypothetical protein